MLELLIFCDPNVEDFNVTNIEIKHYSNFHSNFRKVTVLSKFGCSSERVYGTYSEVSFEPIFFLFFTFIIGTLALCYCRECLKQRANRYPK